MNIPKIIHQIWWQGIDKLPNKYRIYRNSWIKNHPNWNIIVWDQKSFEDLLFNKVKNNLNISTYNQLPHMIQKIDYAKYVILNYMGGVYVDMDTVSEKSIEELLNKTSKGLILSKLEVYKIINFKLINNGILISCKNHPFYKYLFRLIFINRKQKFYHNKDWYIMDSTGPLVFSNAVMIYLQESYSKDIEILEDNFLESCKMMEYSECNKKGVYITHYHDCSWCSSILLLHFKLLRFFYKNKYILFSVFFAIFINIFYLYNI